MMPRKPVFTAILGGLLAAGTQMKGAQSPSFTLQPHNQTVVAGNDVTFSAAASGATPMTYQWWFNGNILTGQTNTDLIVLSVTLTNAGTYWLGVTNSHGGIVSSNATLTVGYPPLTVNHPVSQTAVLNSNVQFSVTATGSPPLAYQWRLNGIDVSTATNSSLLIAAMQPGSAGAYSVVVTNSYGAVTSDTATLTMATPPEFLWVRRVTNNVYGFTGTSYGRHMAIDGAGNVFVIGSYNGWGVDFGGAMLTNTPAAVRPGSFICKYDRWGNFQWVRQFSTNGFPTLRVGTDGGGNVYITGDYRGIAMDGTLFSSGARFMFLAKYDSGGQRLWARDISAQDPSGGTSGRAFAVDSAGNAFLIAAYQDTVWIGTSNLTGTAAFFAKYDTDGNLAWLKGATPATAICVGNSGAIYACQVQLTKYDSGGNQLWSRPFASAQCMTLDGDENIYASGAGNGTYGDLIVTNVSGIRDFFLAKCNSDGQLVWSRQLGSTKQQTGTGVEVDSFGNVHVVSMSASAQREPVLSFGNTMLTNVMSLLLKYDGAGNPLWARGLGGTNRASAAAIRVLNPGTVFLAGTFYGAAQFDSFNLSSDQPGFEDLYLGAVGEMDPPTSPRLSGMACGGVTNQVQFQVAGVAGLKYGIEASTNFVDWIRLQTNVSPFVFVDNPPAGCRQRFYRAVWVQ